MHVLLVENQEPYITRWSTYLTYLGHSVACARTYTEAVAKFEAERPDLLICDNHLDECVQQPDSFDAGYFFISKVRKEGFTGRIIFYTGSPRNYFEGELDISNLDVRFIRKKYKRKKI